MRRLAWRNVVRALFIVLAPIALYVYAVTLAVQNGN